MTPTILGIDPGTKKIGIAVVRDTTLIHIDIAKGKNQIATIDNLSTIIDDCDCSHYGITTVVIESQQYYLEDQEKKSKPEDLIKLAFMSGAAAAFCTQYLPNSKIVQVFPKVWKGNVPKHIKQKRILTKLNIPISHYMKTMCPVPDVSTGMHCKNMLKVNDGDWRDILDAAGLALWGLEEVA